ncbi:O-methyltransferase [Vallitalea okinawensis]|uniref:O-methyltransferase n=1 Tax=Vallitalea okinawensis TaxID=2078660 RepID=UPI000CFDDD91|nr:O-methyltransferase [Vallitalea okinawensis]
MQSYIDNLYKDRPSISKAKYITETKLQDFIPVVDEDVARTLALILQISKAKQVLEIGTSIGYSTVSMAKILQQQNGRITTIEYDEVVADQAKCNFINAGINEIVDLKIGDARDILPTLESESYDLIFLDVDKTLYKPLLKTCISLLKRGGILLAEDTLFPILNLEEKWRYLIPSIEAFNQAIIKSDEIDSTILPIGDGLTIAVKKLKAH